SETRASRTAGPQVAQKDFHKWSNGNSSRSSLLEGTAMDCGKHKQIQCDARELMEMSPFRRHSREQLSRRLKTRRGRSVGVPLWLQFQRMDTRSDDRGR